MNQRTMIRLVIGHSLGIGLPRLSSYTYGRTATASKDVTVRARNLLEENDQSTATVAAKFDKPMSEILADWSKLLGTTSNDENAGNIGVTGMTIQHWKNKETKSDLTALGRHDCSVTKPVGYVNPKRMNASAPIEATPNMVILEWTRANTRSRNCMSVVIFNLNSFIFFPFCNRFGFDPTACTFLL